MDVVDIPLVMTNSLLLKMTIDVVFFPLKMVDLSIVMLVIPRGYKKWGKCPLWNFQTIKSLH